MSITQIEIGSFQENSDATVQLAAGKVAFNQVCVVNEPEWLQQYNIFWIRRGRSTVEVDFQAYPIEAESLLFLSPGQIFTVLSEEIVEGYHLSFGEDFYCLDTHHSEVGCNGLLFSNFLDVPYLRVGDDFATTLEPHFKAIEENLVGQQVAQAELLQSYLKIFLIRCVQYKRKTAPKVELPEEQESDWLVEFNRLVEKHFREWHNVADYAEALFISPKTLTHRLARYDRKPSDLIQERIILEAKRLLAHSGQTVKEITYDLGFEDPAYFSRFFKRNTELSPGQFREKMHRPRS